MYFARSVAGVYSNLTTCTSMVKKNDYRKWLSLGFIRKWTNLYWPGRASSSHYVYIQSMDVSNSISLCFCHRSLCRRRYIVASATIDKVLCGSQEELHMNFSVFGHIANPPPAHNAKVSSPAV